MISHKLLGASPGSLLSHMIRRKSSGPVCCQDPLSSLIAPSLGRKLYLEVAVQIFFSDIKLKWLNITLNSTPFPFCLLMEVVQFHGHRICPDFMWKHHFILCKIHKLGNIRRTHFLSCSLWTSEPGCSPHTFLGHFQFINKHQAHTALPKQNLFQVRLFYRQKRKYRHLQGVI